MSDKTIETLNFMRDELLSKKRYHLEEIKAKEVDVEALDNIISTFDNAIYRLNKQKVR